MRPGITTAPCRSTTSAPCAICVSAASGPMAIIRPSFTARVVRSRSNRIGSAMVIMPEALRNTASGLRDSTCSMVGSLHCYWNGRPLDRCDRNHFSHLLEGLIQGEHLPGDLGAHGARVVVL